MDELSIAWAAGLFEGEGCLGTGSRTAGLIRACLTMTDEDAVRRFASVMGVGNVVFKPYRNPLKDQWAWDAHGDDAVVAIKSMLPWLCARRTERAKELLDARAALIAEATRERICPRCRSAFRAPFNSGWRRRKFCSPECKHREIGQRYYRRHRRKILAHKAEKWDRERRMDSVRGLSWEKGE